MRQTLLRRLRAAILAISLPVVALLTVAATGGATAYASSSGGAQHEVGTQCYPDSYDPTLTDCYTIDALVQDTYTPSGNESEFFHGTEAFTVYDSSGNVVFSDSTTGSGHSLFQQGQPQEDAYSFTETVTYTGGSCYYTVFFHFANGSVQFDREGGTC